ncbi:MAG: DUF2007 domain-containing protein [Flavobacteriales bacterium]|nr:DUF2007 domain-containing protein [Flavobacteriales bacterium]MCB0785683.1 DUF2007 domain-containing protein [Flavobacteriales bacterium]MCB0788677.1 DUF2007 domain-containing protein [Flavobacteriales bacterium]MCB0807720.1 DUF2007 domain-containing protein [Flavobacteriales bacterium]MCB0812801.1 DUF2007 domain-containing protein [Flavobacteriales bacterium]
MTATDWTEVYNTTDPHEAELLRGMLEAEEVQAFVMDHRSSAYPNLGEVKVMVPRELVVRAIHLVKKFRGT